MLQIQLFHMSFKKKRKEKLSSDLKCHLSRLEQRPMRFVSLTRQIIFLFFITFNNCVHLYVRGDGACARLLR